MSVAPTGTLPIPLTHARGLGAVLRAARDSKIDIATVRVQLGDHATDVVVHDPERVAADGERIFRVELQHAVRDVLDGIDEQGQEKVGALKAGWRAAMSYCSRKVSDVTPDPVKSAAAVTYKGAATAGKGLAFGAKVAKPAVFATGRLLGRGYDYVARKVTQEVTARSEIAADVIRRTETAQMVATRVFFEVTHKDGAVSCFAPWVIDPVATLRNEQLTASLNGAVSLVGLYLVGSAMQLAAAGTFLGWGLLSTDRSERNAKVNMALDQLVSSGVSLIPGSTWFTAPRAAAQDISDLIEIKDGMREGDPFVTFYPSRTGFSENEGEAASQGETTPVAGAV